MMKALKRSPKQCHRPSTGGSRRTSVQGYPVSQLRAASRRQGLTLTISDTQSDISRHSVVRAGATSFVLDATCRLIGIARAGIKMARAGFVVTRIVIALPRAGFVFPRSLKVIT